MTFGIEKDLFFMYYCGPKGSLI